MAGLSSDDRCLVPNDTAHFPGPSTVTLADVLNEVRALAARIDQMQTPTVHEYMTVAEAARHFNISPAALYRLKHLHCRRGRSIRFKRQALENHLRPRPYARQAS